MAPVITPKEEVDLKTTSVRLAAAMVEELDQVARDAGQSRNEVIVQLLRYALDAHHAETKKKR
ncbi:MAG: ribbon-helix-helix protein, CopG family [Deltaproteobacteria bacterium]|nr:ribbon-helix-helix protein, CopG family [Deltaproteobacteria bacterium]